VLRLYPSVPINSRTALVTTTLPRGGGLDGTKPLMVRKGEPVGYSVYVMHRLKKLYGEDADSFRPERWDPDVDNAVDLKKIGWGYLPFNGGPRICLGRKSFVVITYSADLPQRNLRC
jgi:cytochrome P450